ncbi:hypothetical protein B5F40_01625 [Gordonibacter sp. An230]|uniref:hypothetical protein n=1 Tax=Gordonibacter sp. An230 TaxID=1965592 RepID=UPI000B3ADD98|nr:hypothetical protein [Gordonibacter sp. An230]OUO92059.1 hypothetical protein B5F40_01625 [Gordonibacter sp. An230]
MNIDSSKFADARRASGLTLENAASICGIARQTYQLREKKAGDFHLSELAALNASMNESGKKLLRDAIYGIFF